MSGHGAERKDQIVPTNPFEDEDGRYFALVNDEGQHSLWPAFADVPDGWTVVHGEDTRKACLDYIEENWTDMRPKSLIEEMNKYEKQNGKRAAKTVQATVEPDDAVAVS
jgi:MbtH protein